MTAPGHIIAMIRVGTSGNGVRGIAPRWVADPANTYADAEASARQWFDANNLPFQHMLYHPAGALPTGVEGRMQFDQYPRLYATNPGMAVAIASRFRDIAAAGEGEHHSVYLGSLPAYPWKTRTDIARCVAPYMIARKSTLIIDQLNGWPERPVNSRVLGELQMAFASVIGEGGFQQADLWMVAAGVRTMHLADTHETIYGRRPDKYLGLEPGDYIMVSNVPESMREEKSTREEKTAWKVAQASQWVQAGVHVVIEINELAGVTYHNLCGIS